MSLPKFYDNIDLQKRYEDRFDEIIVVFKKKFKGFYDSILHDNMIKQWVRCEIKIDFLEKKIQKGDMIDDTPIKELQQERQHIRSLWEQLQVSMKGQRGDKKNINVHAMKDFKNFAKEVMYEEFDVDDSENPDTV